MLDAMGKPYAEGEYIVREGEVGDCMYVIQSGTVEVVQRRGEDEFCLAVLGRGDFFGEMALFEREVRSASVRALEEVWVLTLEKRAFLRRVHQDPSFAFRILEKMSGRIRALNERLVRIGAAQVKEELHQVGR